MTRHRFAIATVLATAFALSGCATFTDDNLAARVGTHELTEGQLADLVRERIGDEDAKIAPAGAAAEIITTFIVDATLRDDLVERGETPPAPVAPLTATGLQTNAQTVAQLWSTLPPPTIEPAVLRAAYEQGPAESNLICAAHILVDTEAEAVAVLDRLDQGESFADVAADVSVDPGSKDSGGALPCDSAASFATAIVPEFAQAALAGAVGEPIGPVESQFGFHVILLRPFDDIASAEFVPVLNQPPVRFGFLLDDVEIYVDPRFGTFDGARGFTPLG